MGSAAEVLDDAPMAFDEAAAHFVARMQSHNVAPVMPTPEHSSIKGNCWHLSNAQGLLARVCLNTGEVN